MNLLASLATGPLPIAIAVLLVLSTLAAALPNARVNPRGLSLALAALASAAILTLGIAVLAPGATVTAGLGEVLGFPLVRVCYDGLAALFLIALGAGGLASSVYAIGSSARDRGSDRTAPAYPVFIGSLALVFGASDAFAFLLAWELMALSSAALVLGARPSGDTARAAYLYFTLTHLATAALVVAFAILVSAAGTTSFEAFGAAAADLSPAARSVVFVLLLVGFGTKAGAIPFHVWLPRAHPVAPSHVSALMSGVMIKAGIYGLVRFGLEILGPGPEWWGLAVLALGAVSAVLGVLYALMEHDLKRLLAFHSIENIGIILLGVGVAMLAAGAGQEGGAVSGIARIALVAALFHTLNHALFKSVLFLAAGSVQRAVGSRDLNQLGGLARTMPVTAVAFAVGAAAISGLPPLNGFASEWLTFQGLIGAGGAASLSLVARSATLIAVGALGLTTALAVVCFVKATGMGFLARPRSAAAAAANETPRAMGAAMAGLALACVAIGIAAGPVSGAIGTVATTVLGQPAVAATGPGIASALGTSVPGLEAAYGALPLAVLISLLGLVGWGAAVRGRRVRREPTWTCGVAPEPAFQYTATSYAKLIRLYFGPVLRPAREVRVELHPGTPFPRTVRYRGEISHLIDERIYRPLHGATVRAAELIRRVQSGSLQLYLAYSVTALVVLLLVARR
ncbi:MAG: hydrogenase 4 subunit B [Chloroflexota bacterium]|nr:MAG: hydrogenase 4 subunit B [Chloroflexota bacterium]